MFSVPARYRYLSTGTPRYVPVPGRYQSKFSLKAGILETEKGIVVYSFLWPCTKYVVSLKVACRKLRAEKFKRALLLKQVLH